MVRHIVPEDQIPYKTYYWNHKNTIDRLHKVIVKYKIDSREFFNFAVKQTKIYTPELLLRPGIFLEFARRKEERNRLEKIYKFFEKSVNNIAETCVERNITAKEYIRELIVQNRIAYEFMSGRISKYFIASIQNFKQIYKHLDEMNKSELRIIYNAADELNAMLQDAFLMKTGTYAKPMSSVESRIIKLKQSKTNN